MIVGTAGHIDHGKSALVAALSGRPMDRLAEERRRGITIDLNFAPLALPGGAIAGMVDVPGHEDFVRTMVAGASGIDLALLVVAADEGIMPQTLEHLAVLEHLGIAAGIPVVTKADLVEPEWLDLVLLEVAERLAGSSVPFEAPVATSVRTGRGLDELKARLAARAATLEPRRGADLFRLPVDRSFSLAGVGTVVTGTAWSGRLRIGDAVTLLPSGRAGRVRSIESYGRTLEQSEPGARTALGLAGLTREDAHRGTWLVAAEAAWPPSAALDVELALQPDAPRPLVSRSRVRVHLGTAEVMARVQPRAPIEPGGRGLARLVLERPMVARGGDRFVVRSYSPVTTIGGGRVLDPEPPRRRAAWPAALGEHVAGGAPAGAARAPARWNRDRGAARAAGSAAGRGGGRRPRPERHPPGGRSLGARGHPPRARRPGAGEPQGRTTATHPSDRGMPLETLRHGLRAPEALVERALADAAAAGQLRLADGVAVQSGFTPRVEGGDAEIDRVVRILEEAELSPPSLAELERQTGRRDIAAILRLAAQTGRVEAVERERYYARPALERFAATLADIGRGSLIAPAEIRDRLGISRKFMIPLLEWADAKGITERVGDQRRLRNA